MLDALSFPPWKNLDAEAKPDNGNAIWDPTPVWDSHTDTVWFFFNGPGREAADCINGMCSTWATKSTDKGLSVRRASVPWVPLYALHTRCYAALCLRADCSGLRPRT